MIVCGFNATWKAAEGQASLRYDWPIGTKKGANMLQTLTALLVCQLAGEVCMRMLGWGIPGPVFGMLLMFFALGLMRRIPDSVASTANTLLGHLSLLFVPAGVGVMSHWDRVGDEWLAIIVALVGSTVVALLVTGLVLKFWHARGLRHE